MKNVLCTSPRLVLFAALLLALLGSAHAKTCAVQAYGAKPDGTTMNTKAIQAAIDACAKSGGTVELSGGVFVSGPIVLKSNVTLNIAKGTTLQGSTNHDDYPNITEMRNPAKQPLISATKAENIAITGEGIIDGMGQSWWKEARDAGDHGIMGIGVVRPRLVVFNFCKHIRMEGVTVQNSPFWQIVPYYSDDLVFRNIKVLADPHSPNTDAIDPFSSSDIVIDHVFADVGDDDVAIKSGQINSPGPDVPSKNITITHCEFHHGHGISIGSEIAGGAQNIVADDIHFVGTDNGVRVKANRDRGNDVGNITFRNITMEDVKTPILISEYYPHMLPEVGDDIAKPVTRLTPHFHDITIENLTATGATTAGVVIGLPEAQVLNVVMKNISIASKKGFVIANAHVTGENVVIKPATGEPITIDPSATVKLK
jgi:polygalacturonase